MPAGLEPRHPVPCNVRGPTSAPNREFHVRGVLRLLQMEMAHSGAGLDRLPHAFDLLPFRKAEQVVYPSVGWQLLPTATQSEPGQMPDEILTLSEVARLLKVAEKTLYTMAQQGELPAFKVRAQWRFKRNDIEAWIQRQKHAIKGPK